MTRFAKHLLIPLFLPVLFFAWAALPVELFGCRNRGLIAALLALAGALLGVAAAGMAIKDKLRGDADSFLWMVSALILAIPAAFIVLTAN